jgi:hypothetical protein
MRSSLSRATALVLATALCAPGMAVAQQSEPAESSSAALTGAWEGWARLTNDWPGLACRYTGGADAVSVRMEIGAQGGQLTGSIAIDLPAEPASGCPPLRKRYSLRDATQAAGTLAFTDSGGNEWNLSARRGGRVLNGLMAWRAGGPEQPLAEGFTAQGGVRPLSRLSGEVRLTRPGAAEPEETAAAPAAETAAPQKKAGGGSHLKNFGLILGANVVGLGALYAANKLGKGSSESGVVTCSPRVCIVGAPNAPCFCEGNVVSGASCGTTTGGAPIGAPCDGKSVPCQAGLSCNGNVCEDRFGRCLY